MEGKKRSSYSLLQVTVWNQKEKVALISDAKEKARVIHRSLFHPSTYFNALQLVDTSMLMP